MQLQSYLENFRIPRMQRGQKKKDLSENSDAIQNDWNNFLLKKSIDASTLTAYYTDKSCIIRLEISLPLTFWKCKIQRSGAHKMLT